MTLSTHRIQTYTRLHSPATLEAKTQGILARPPAYEIALGSSDFPDTVRDSVKEQVGKTQGQPDHPSAPAWILGPLPGGRCRSLGRAHGSAALPFSDAKESSESSEITQEQLLENFHLMAPSEEDMPVPWNAVSSYRIMRAGYASDTDSDKLKVRPWGRCQAELVGFPGAQRPGNECFPAQGLLDRRFPPQLCPAFPAGTLRRGPCWVESQVLCCVASDVCLSPRPTAQPPTLQCSPRTPAPPLAKNCDQICIT